MDWKYESGFILLVLLKAVSSTVVQTTHGPVDGKVNKLWNGKIVEGFLGIPFAAPPTGGNRFLPPQPLSPWTETLQAKSLPLSCNQAVTDELRDFASFVSLTEESEDCLYLNLWVPKNIGEEKKAVLIWIHGGGYFAGSSNLGDYDGSILATENDVIVASMNYRLAMFGFLFFNDSQVPGNAGLQDQIQAIKWIRNNIEAFGGDPNRITLFGQSAGSISVSAHLTNKNVYDDFQRAIMLSGHPSLATMPMEEALKHSMTLAQNLGCAVGGVAQMLECMRSKSTSELLSKYEGVNLYLRIPYVPVRNDIEVPIHATTAAQSVPTEKKKNIISGNVPKEMSYFLEAFFPGKKISDSLTISETDLRGLLNDVYMISDSRLQDVIIHEGRDFDGSQDPGEYRVQASDVITDSSMLCPQVNFTKDWVTGENQVYYFSFKHRPSRPARMPLPEWLQVVHGDENNFVFGLPVDPKYGYTNAEKQLSQRVMAYFTNFAKTGNPNHEGLLRHWPALKPKGELTHMELDLKLNIRNHLREKPCHFWEVVYPSLLSVQGQLK